MHGWRRGRRTLANFRAGLKEPLKNLLRAPIAASRARSLLAYLYDMFRRSLRGSLRLGLLATVLQRFLRAWPRMTRLIANEREFLRGDSPDIRVPSRSRFSA